MKAQEAVTPRHMQRGEERRASVGGQKINGLENQTGGEQGRVGRPSRTLGRVSLELSLTSNRLKGV